MAGGYLCSASLDSLVLGCASQSASIDSLAMQPLSLASTSTQFYRSAKKKKGFGLPSMSGIFQGLFSSGEPKATKAVLGGPSSMYYDVEKKQWRERGQERADPEPDAEEFVAPPPMAQHAKPAK